MQAMGNVTATPVFSIIIPTYQRAYCLPVAIESVLRQTFADWELIVVDDGSTDETRAVVARYCEADARVRYVWQENKERSAARNHGASLARGRYFCFLDDDDYYLEHHLAACFEELNLYPYPVIVRAEGYRIEVGGKSVVSPLLYGFDNPFSSVFFDGTAPIFYALPCELFESEEFPVGVSYSEDWHLLVRAMLRYQVVFTKSISVAVHYIPLSKEKACSTVVKVLGSTYFTICDLERYYGSVICNRLGMKDAFKRKRWHLLKATLKMTVRHPTCTSLYSVLGRLVFKGLRSHRR